MQWRRQRDRDPKVPRDSQRSRGTVRTPRCQADACGRAWGDRRHRATISSWPALSGLDISEAQPDFRLSSVVGTVEASGTSEVSARAGTLPLAESSGQANARVPAGLGDQEYHRSSV